MLPSDLAILIGAGSNTGAEIARILSYPSHGYPAVALFARPPRPLNDLALSLHQANPVAVLETFTIDISPYSLKTTLQQIKVAWRSQGFEIMLGGIQHQTK